MNSLVGEICDCGDCEECRLYQIRLKFERDLEAKGCGDAPNGASYKLIPWGKDDAPAIQRETPNGDGTRTRDIVVGMYGEVFTSFRQAEAYAMDDGKRDRETGQQIA